MDRKKKREKFLANGGVADVQTGDVQREDEQGCAKKLASAPSTDSPTQPFLPSFNWPVNQRLLHPLSQMPHSQPASQGANQSVSGWQNSDVFGQCAGAAQQHPFQPGPGDSTWHHQPGQGVGARPPPFGFPPPPYPGPWDPVSWWGHNPYQPSFPYMFPGYGSGYTYHMSPVPPVGPNQRGLIKPPPGLSQKHIRVWEMQSMENIQLWTTTTQLWAAVARADAEISVQRGKILKLEAEIQQLKANRDGQTSQAEVTLPSGARRGRRKKAVVSTLAAAAGLSTSGAVPMQASSRKANTTSAKVDATKTAKEAEATDKEKSIAADQMPELGFGAHLDFQHKKSCLNTGGNNKDESGLDKNTLRQKVEYQCSTNNTLMTPNTYQINPRCCNIPLTGKMSNSSSDQKIGMKESIVASLLKNTGNLDHQSVLLGDCSFTAAISRMTCGHESNGYDTSKDEGVRSQLQGQIETRNIEKSNMLLGKGIPNWQYLGEDGSDEQDEAVASARDDDEPDDDEDDDEDDDTGLDDMHNDKVGNCMVLDPLTMKWQ